ncbi:hypothetical protein HNQ80_001382 [Anaerosolibacter carboniphilus]|uniref:Uncharacterized protein n=1 Tax=Anaerosolibacter carboniphilus TaxID=1417629 RepID=A0A841KPE7_9FIRM|nr:hypothetical protein [Anaerosolibacter carboniphilus]
MNCVESYSNMILRDSICINIQQKEAEPFEKSENGYKD